MLSSLSSGLYRSTAMSLLFSRARLTDSSSDRSRVGRSGDVGGGDGRGATGSWARARAGEANPATLAARGSGSLPRGSKLKAHAQLQLTRGARVVVQQELAPSRRRRILVVDLEEVGVRRGPEAAVERHGGRAVVLHR